LDMKRTPQKTPAHSGKSFWLFVLVGLVFWTASDTFVLAGLADATEAATENACTNGSFEILGKNGFPADWGPVGQQVSVSEDAHSGQRSLRMVRTAETVTPETGLNRTRLITELKGGVDFWYKAISASPGTNLNIYVIPINEEGVERTGSPRATFTVPEDHIGDGQWHHARLKYDYTDNPKVKSVHFAARIVGTTGELLLDDFQYISRVGPVPLIKKLMLEEDTKRPGRSGKVRVLLTNAGDEPARDVHLVVQTAGAVKGPTAELQLPVLAPEEIKPLYFPLPMIRQQAVMITATAKCGELSDTRRLELRPALRVRSFGPAEPVVVQGQAAVLECELENTGQVILSGITVTFETPLGQARQVVQSLAPHVRRSCGTHSFRKAKRYGRPSKFASKPGEFPSLMAPVFRRQRDKTGCGRRSLGFVWSRRFLLRPLRNGSSSARRPFHARQQVFSRGLLPMRTALFCRSVGGEHTTRLAGGWVAGLDGPTGVARSAGPTGRISSGGKLLSVRTAEG
jgi:hypothetical protein